jgi:hypothetical protein
MVFTRSKARQRARSDAQSVPSDTETPEISRAAVEKRAKKSAKKAVIRISPVASPTKQLRPASRTKSRQTTTEEENIDELALRALRARQGMTSSEIDPESIGTESEEDSQPSIMTLEPDAIPETIPPPVSVKTRRPDILATTLKPSVEESLYFSYSRKKGISRTVAGKAATTWGESEEDLMKRSVVTSDFEKKEVAPPMYVSKYAKARARKEAREKSAGKGWYEMEAPQMTPELQNDLKLLRMRNALDPSQHYKGSDWKKLPRYFQVGKVVSGPAEFYSSRVPRRQRKMTIMDELLHNHQFRRYQKKKYAELQIKFSSGTRRKRFMKHKKHYKKQDTHSQEHP